MTSLSPRPEDDRKKRQRDTDDWFARAAKKSVAKLVDSPVVDLFLRAADAKKKKADDERLQMRGVMRPF
jgi:hypothetical protein